MNTNFLDIVPSDNLIRHYAKIMTEPLYIAMAIVDFILVVLLVLYLLKAIKNTRVLQLFKGIALLLIANFLSKVLQLPILHAIFSSITTYGILILVIIFQPELRKMLEQLGTSKLNNYFGITGESSNNKMKENIYKIAIACNNLAKTKTGALIVIEKDIKLQEIIQSGIPLNADVSVQLLENIFVKDTPLHDGAVVISEGVIKSACSILPLSTDNDINKAFGTRHRAALGMAKSSDAVVVVVSEETGKITVAKEGTLIVDLKEDVLKKVLIKALIKEENKEQRNNINKIKKAFNNINNN